jgi:hypothetical protein
MATPLKPESCAETKAVCGHVPHQAAVFVVLMEIVVPITEKRSVSPLR